MKRSISAVRSSGSVAGIVLAVVFTAAPAGQAGLVDYQGAVTGESSLISYYTFDAGSANDTAGTNHGTDVGTVLYNSVSYGGQAISLNGTGHINIGLVPAFDFADGSGTVEAWIQPTWTSSPGYNPAVLASRNGSPVRYSIHELASGAQITVWTGTVRAYAHGAISYPQWHHLVTVFDSGSATVYFDGVSLGTQSIGLGAAGQTFQIGSASAAGTGQERWVGGLDEVALYSDPLSAAAVQQHYEAMFPPVRVLDFETGDMDGWYAVAGPGNNLVFRAGNMPTAKPFVGFNDASVQGDYFVRTYEGEVLGNSDAHTGIAETTPFILGKNARFDFLIGGGNHPFSGDPDAPAADVTALNLERMVAPGDWEVVFTATGINANTLRPLAWDASAYAGDTVRLRIYDTHTSGWGHIDVDNVRYSATDLPGPSGLWSVDIQATPGGAYGQPIATTMMGVEPAYGFGNFWNAFVVAAYTGTSTDPSMALVDSNGNPTGVAFSVAGTVSGFNYAGDLEEDYLITDVPGASAAIDWTITGLEAEGWYQMYFYPGHLAGRDFDLLIDTDGDGSLETQLNVAGVGGLVDFIVADPSGTIHGRIFRPSGGEGNWAGFQLRYIPEPSTFALLGLGLFGLAGYGRRRRKR